MKTLEETDEVDDLDTKIRQRKNSIANRNLLVAARNGDLELVYSCISEGANINFVDRDGNTAIHYAVKSGNVDVVTFFVNNVEDINVENNENRTPLDIAFALKQNDIIALLSEINMEGCIEILENQDLQSNDTGNKLNFMEATFNYDYEIPLSKGDIQNILDFTYFRRDRENVFKAIDTMDDLEKEVEVFLSMVEKEVEVKKTRTLIFNLEGISWVTLVLHRTKKDDEDQFKAYYLDPRGKILPTGFKDKLQSKGINDVKELIKDCQLNLLDNTHDSGIFALRYTEECNPFSDENKVKEKLKNLELDVKKARELYANILREKKRVEDKIIICLETLQNLNKNKSNVDMLNHKNANVFINFLETFALQDTYPEMSSLTPDKLDRNKTTLTDLKKGYFTTFYFQTKNNKDPKSDYNRICSARRHIFHSSKIIQPEDFRCFMQDETSVDDFFQKLELYTENIKNKIDKYLENNIDDIPCHSFLALGSNIGKQNEGDFLSMLRKFLLDIYKPEDKMDQDKVIFDVIVNIIPVMDSNKEKLRPLSVMRNNLVHNYHEKSISNTENKFKEIEQLHSLRSDIFKFYYSKEVHGLLCNRLLQSNFEALQNEFQKKLENFQSEINKEENVGFISSVRSKSFEYIFQESLFPESDENLNSLVDKYLKFAFMVEKKAVQVENRDEEVIRSKKITDDKKREIFEDFMKLNKTQGLTPPQFQYEINARKKLKEKLKMYGLEVSYFDRILRHYLDDINELSGESIKKRDKIINTLSVLKQIKKDFSLSSKIIIDLYEKVLELKQKGIANLRQCGSILDEEWNKSKLTESQKESRKSSILKELCNLPGMETVDIMVGDAKITELNTFDIIRNILSVFCNSYYNYKIKFNNIVEAFNDDTFLHYLVNLNIEQSDSCKILKDKYFIFTIIKKLITVEYACPYISGLLTESKDGTVIEKNDFILLLRTLLKKIMYTKHLVKLLNLKSENFDVYGEFCNLILSSSFNIENIHVILQDHNHVRAILNKLYAKIKNAKRNLITDYEALKVEEFVSKVLNDDFSIIQDYVNVKVILNRVISMSKNGNNEQAFKICVKKVTEFCEKFSINSDFNVINVLYELEENNMKNVLCELKAKVRNEVSYGKEKEIRTIEEIIIELILKQLNVITSELHCESYYEDAVKILETSIEIGKKLSQSDELENILLDAEFQKQRSIIQLAITEKDKRAKKKNIAKALRILRRIRSTDEKSPKFLLISAEIANAECLLRKYDKSYESYKRLFEKIAFDIPTDEFIKIENSKEYQKMLALSSESKKYLNIINIQTSMAYNKKCEGLKLGGRKRYDMAIDNHKEALRIYEKLYSFMKESLKDTLESEKSITQFAVNILKSKLIIGGLYYKKEEFGRALQYYQGALVKCIQCSSSITKIYTNFHPSFKKNKTLMEDIVTCIEKANAQQFCSIDDCFENLPLDVLRMW